MFNVASWIYEYSGILLVARPILHISRIKVNLLGPRPIFHISRIYVKRAVGTSDTHDEASRNCFEKPPEAKTHKFRAVPVRWML
jgi:hypothetical protein